MQEFQVILLSGGLGSRMFPLTEEISKALLPVGERPIILYQLETLENLGFRDVIVVLHKGTGAQLSHYLNDIYEGPLKLDTVEMDDMLGTAEVLVRIRDKITMDFLIISGDLLSSCSFIYDLADLHRRMSSAVTMVLAEKPAASTIKDPKKKIVESNDFIALDPHNQIRFFASSADFDEVLSINNSLLLQNPNLFLHSTLGDLHFYCFSHWVLDILTQNPTKFSSIKGDLIPYLVDLQNKKSEESSIKEEISVNRVEPVKKNGCYAVFSTEYYVRVNTLPSFIKANQDISRDACTFHSRLPKRKGSYIHESAYIPKKTQIGGGCLIGASTQIGQRCGIRKSVIGRNCKIGDNVKITNCVIMDSVTIEMGSVISDSIFCNDVYIKQHSTLIDCHLGVSVIVEEKSSMKNEQLTRHNTSAL